ncbi:hypothetical protein O3M35_000756 [Rhynocoris fuscipes]|uniref:5-azacytidine-induced protein 1 n=1 Tax=Rhynocoris fuscipes TaxID=488301 RepID=A0AAW1DS71_9HEMI
MPFADKDKERKQNEENTLLDFRVYGKQISLNTRRSPSSSRSSSRTEPTYRAMSATPSLYLEERHRKTPPWTRPQSADLTREGNHRRKIAAKFDRCSERRGSKNRKPSGSISNLLDTNSLDDSLDSETSVTPSPVPSLTDVLRPSNKLQPGLSAKPPIPPNCSNLIDSKKNHKSMDDIINIKFQRWFPESVQNNSCELESMENGISKGSISELAGPSRRKINNEVEIPLSKTPETQVNRLGALTNYHFDAYEGSPVESSTKKISRSQTMETIIETEDSVPNTPEKNINNNNNNVSFELNNLVHLDETRPLKTDTSVNKYLNNSNGNEESKTKKKKVTINDSARSESSSSGIATMIEECDSPSKVMSHLLSQPEEIPNEHAISKILEDEHASCILKYVEEDAQENKKIDQNSNSANFVLPSNGENGGLNNADILSWIGSSSNNNNNNNIHSEKSTSSTYNDIINMLKVLEKEEVDSVKLEALTAGRSGNNSVCSNVTPVRSSCRDILTYLDDLDRSDSRNELRTPQENKTSLEECEKPNDPQGNNSSSNRPNSSRLAQLMSFDSAELARRVMALTLELEERETVLERTKERMAELQNKLSKNKTDTDAIVRRHQQFIDQLLSEKRLLGEQCASIVKEMENKHKKTLQTIEERHGIELKKLQEKMLAAEKIRREKWLDEKTKKIKEQTVRGLEPELERLTRAHQDELAEIRRAHERELAEMEASCSRRIATAREQALRDREQAVADEREAARNKLEHEMSELERSYQDQRRRLMAEVREEKERLTREAESNLAQRARQLEEKWQESHAQLQETLNEMQNKHQMEIKQMKETVEAERQSWLTHQTAALSDKERQIKEQCKKERDRHIEAVIKKLDQDSLEKQKHLETKLIRMKEQHESEIKEAEVTEMELRKKLKESRSENQQYEDTVGKLKTQITHLEYQLATAKQQLDHLGREANERGNQARNEVSAQLATLQRELTEEKLKREEAVSALQAEKERDLQQVYNRVKEAIAKKDETLRLVQKQRDAALEQCCQLENMLEQQRKEFAQRKNS